MEENERNNEAISSHCCIYVQQFFKHGAYNSLLDLFDLHNSQFNSVVFK